VLRHLEVTDCHFINGADGCRLNGTKRTSKRHPAMSAFGGKADITATVRNFNLLLPQKLRQLGNIGRNPPRLVGKRLISFFSSQPWRWQA
jgi:hypothetical protein